VWISFALSGLFTSILAVVWIHVRLKRVEAEMPAAVPRQQSES